VFKLSLIKVKNTYKLPLKGRPSRDIIDVLSIDEISVSPPENGLVKPKLLVKQGDSVKRGEALFIDKIDDRIRFVSPASGTIKEIVFGERRRLLKIVVTVAKTEEDCLFDVSNLSDKQALVDTLLKAGLWQRMVQYPFQKIPSPDSTPPSIYVTLDYDAPFFPETDLYLKGNEDALKKGLEVLSTLASGKLNVGISLKSSAPDSIRSLATHIIDGDYPANDPGVFLYHNKKDASENASWGIRGMDVVKIGQLFLTGKYPYKQQVVVAGSNAQNPSHVNTREGVLYKDLVTSTDSASRYIAGSPLNGRNGGSDGSLSYGEYALHVIPEGQEQEMLTFFRLGLNKPTYSRTYLSSLFRQKEHRMTSSMNGGHRSCVSCGACPDVCPTGLAPQIIMKNLHAGDIEEAVRLGFLDCVDCGLCTYVCPSKIDLATIFKQSRERLAKEV
jgi:Na+-transporting NADH:ubiquinone oxidoreductase subunit A